MATFVDPLPSTRYRDWRGHYKRPHTFKFEKKCHQRIRSAVYAADGFTCRSCGYKPEAIPDLYDGSHNLGRLQIDHIIPLRSGGARFDLANLQTLCRSCNAGKGCA